MNRLVDNVVSFPRAKRLMPVQPAPRRVEAPARARACVFCYIVAALWLVAAMLTPILSLPLGIWACIELMLIAFGRPAWHFFAVFGSLVALHAFVGAFTPKLFSR